MSTGEPDATEIGHVRFGGGPTEKDLDTGTSPAAYPTARPVRAGGHWKRNCNPAETSPVAYRCSCLTVVSAKGRRVAYSAGPCRVAEEFGDLPWGGGVAEVVSLPRFAADGSQDFGLVGGFHTLSGDRQAERVA
jgi:hypothetical protein